jgi:hypothetical protein
MSISILFDPGLAVNGVAGVTPIVFTEISP